MRLDRGERLIGGPARRRLGCPRSSLWWGALLLLLGHRRAIPIRLWAPHVGATGRHAFLLVARHAHGQRSE
jgi:hypothetical protein